MHKALISQRYNLTQLQSAMLCSSHAVWRKATACSCSVIAEFEKNILRIVFENSSEYAYQLQVQSIHFLKIISGVKTFIWHAIQLS